MKQITLLALTLLFLQCQSDREFPEVKSLENCKQTSFVTTLDEPINPQHNAIYAVSFLYAWEEIKKELSPLEIKNTYQDLQRINQATHHQNSLEEEAIQKTVEKNNNEIAVRAYFKQSLPFEEKLNRYNNRLDFGELTLDAFGLMGETELDECLSILYYKNDQDFAIRLQPKNEDHEILLYLPPHQQFKDLVSVYKELKTKIKVGKEEVKEDRKFWRFKFEEEDELLIPVLKFNYETNYTQLLENTFIANDEREWKVAVAYQRTALILDEVGTKVEAEGFTQVDYETEELLEEDRPKPQKLHFNRPFLLVLKQKESEYPYFMAWVAAPKELVGE